MEPGRADGVARPPVRQWKPWGREPRSYLHCSGGLLCEHLLRSGEGFELQCVAAGSKRTLVELLANIAFEAGVGSMMKLTRRRGRSARGGPGGASSPAGSARRRSGDGTAWPRRCGQPLVAAGSAVRGGRRLRRGRRPRRPRPHFGVVLTQQDWKHTRPTVVRCRRRQLPSSSPTPASKAEVASSPPCLSRSRGNAL